jgi:hypothetical protein
MDIKFKIKTSGKIVCYRGKEVLHSLWEEVAVPEGTTRSFLLSKLEPALVRATRLIYGSSFKPADYNEILAKKSLIRQIMADSPSALIPIWSFIGHKMMKETPKQTIVKRFKELLQRKGAQDFKLIGNGACCNGIDSKGKTRKNNDVNDFWGSYRDFENDPLSEAGWRYLQRLSVKTMREISLKPWRWTGTEISLFNLLGKHGLPAINKNTFDILELSTHLKSEDSKQYFARALITKLSSQNPDISVIEIDVLRDWLYEKTQVVEAGTKWQTIITRAFTLAGEKIELKKIEVAGYQWSPPLEPFVADEGITVIPLVNGTELLAEGIEMANCLRNNESYAQRAVKGVSQVFSLRGVFGRASVEFARISKNYPWEVRQVEGIGGQEITHPAVLRIVEKLGHSLRGM